MYYGFTHGFAPFVRFEFFLKIWRRVFCRKGIHLWDEVESNTEHYMSCDACEKILYISSVDDKYTIK